jgi:hypothetical protein
MSVAMALLALLLGGVLVLVALAVRNRGTRVKSFDGGDEGAEADGGRAPRPPAGAQRDTPRRKQQKGLSKKAEREAEREALVVQDLEEDEEDEVRGASFARRRQAAEAAAAAPAAPATAGGGPELGFKDVRQLLNTMGYPHVGEEWLRGAWQVMASSSRLISSHRISFRLLRGAWQSIDLNGNGTLEAAEVNQLLLALKAKFAPLSEEQVGTARSNHTSNAVQ